MAKFDEHISQAAHNLAFLEKINSSVSDCFDWQITVCFYSALHLVNAHLSKFDLQYRKHSDVNHALNYENRTSLAKLPEDEYIAYTALQSLSRRSRYLVNEKDGNLKENRAFFIYEKHLAKALKHLDTLLHYFNLKYGLGIRPIEVKCSGIKNNVDFRHMLLR